MWEEIWGRRVLIALWVIICVYSKKDVWVSIYNQDNLVYCQCGVHVTIAHGTQTQAWTFTWLFRTDHPPSRTQMGKAWNRDYIRSWRIIMRMTRIIWLYSNYAWFINLLYTYRFSNAWLFSHSFEHVTDELWHTRDRDWTTNSISVVRIDWLSKMSTNLIRG